MTSVTRVTRPTVSTTLDLSRPAMVGNNTVATAPWATVITRDRLSATA